MLDITLLGSGGSMPMPHRFLSSLLISYKGRKILIDCGEGTQVAMRKMNTGFKNIDIICITHLHGDHVFGLPGLISTMRNSERTEKIVIVGPEGTRGVLRDLLSPITYMPFELDIIENPKTPLEIIKSSVGLQFHEYHESENQEIIFSTLALEHSSPCLGYSFYLKRKPKFSVEKAELNKVPMEIWGRLQKGETVVYDSVVYEPHMVLGEKRRGIKVSFVSDTRPTEAIPDFIRDSDLFICEGTYGDDMDSEKAQRNRHMTFKEAAMLAKDGEVRELLLTHFSPSMDKPEMYRQNAAEIFADVIIGYDGYMKTISFKDE
ncbi:ribonuclease Z [Lutispora thermophila]|uniref:Ribonuclease Z n=1 Tax=Lutispora thermophila DSM 19022 TaxID=1122184 RepID=A0A1M6HCJ7_9FIRM|nr:ribonuclease Z [Lutispora thermophila]SHJ19902.1 RNAse Z [Lutispora thermophila DSM 19022]